MNDGAFGHNPEPAVVIAQSAKTLHDQHLVTQLFMSFVKPTQARAGGA